MEKKHNRTPVKSSAVASIGYDPETKMMEVEMTGGRVYNYPGVPAEAHAAFMAADSHGKHLAAHIRPKYTVKK